ncbi:hypothetical protein [Klebsiella pneumoniae]|nr:hypothetical protein [Klebsiella pneumoniae]
MSFKPTPEEVKQARIKAGFTQQEAAERFGFTLSVASQKKR